MTYERKQAIGSHKTGAGPPATVQALLTSCEAEDFPFLWAASCLAAPSTGPSEVPTSDMARRSTGAREVSLGQDTANRGRSLMLDENINLDTPPNINPRVCQLPKAPHSGEVAGVRARKDA